jgi:hypothetical protein
MIGCVGRCVIACGWKLAKNLPAVTNRHGAKYF